MKSGVNLELLVFEDYLDWLEAQLDQIDHMGIEGYLGSQLE